MADRKKNRKSLVEAMAERRTIREITGGRISSGVLEKLVWAACGHTHRDGRMKMRTAPSAGATYPIEIYAVIERVDGFKDGIYLYDYARDRLLLKSEGHFLESICRVSLEQDFIPLSNVVFLMVYDPLRIQPRYGRDSRKYALLECGHIAQNILLMAADLGMGNVPVGAFYQRSLGTILGIDNSREILYMVCVGTVNR